MEGVKARSELGLQCNVMEGVKARSELGLQCNIMEGVKARSELGLQCNIMEGIKVRSELGLQCNVMEGVTEYSAHAQIVRTRPLYLEAWEMIVFLVKALKNILTYIKKLFLLLSRSCVT